jgi:regulator of protease activity HflC (stomatin/prohibitin superfamily)
MYYRICDPRAAAYEVDDMPSAIQNVAVAQMKEVFGRLSLTDALTSQQAINQHCAQNFGPIFRSWGLEVMRVELLELSPAGQAISSAMRMQVYAERKRRADYIGAEGRKASQRLEAEGTRAVKVNLAVAEQEALRKSSEGKAQARMELARADRASLDAISEVVREDGATQQSFMLGQAYNSFLRGIRASTSTIYLPYDPAVLRGLIGTLPRVFGKVPSLERTRRAEARLPPPSARALADDATPQDDADLN